MDQFPDKTMQDGCHPLKRLRRQAIDNSNDDGFDDLDHQMAAQGRPAATVVNMR